MVRMIHHLIDLPSRDRCANRFAWPVRLVLCVALALGGCVPSFPPESGATGPDSGLESPTAPGSEVFGTPLDGPQSSLSQPYPGMQPLTEEEVRNYPPLERDRLLEEAQRLENDKNVQGAVVRYRQFLLRYPDAGELPGVLVSLGKLRLDQGNLEEADAYFAAARRSHDHPASGWARLFQGESALKGGKADQAWGLWTTLFSEPPPLSDRAWTRFIESYFEHGSAENTMAFLNAAPRQPLSQEQSRKLIHVAGMQTRERLESLLAFQPTISPVAPFANLALGDLLAQAGEEAQARAAWEKAGATGATLGEAERRLAGLPTGEAIRIGLLLPMSGRWSNLGDHLLQSVQKALADYRDIPLVLITADSGGEAGTAVAAFSELAAQGVEAVIGPVFREPALAVAQAAVTRRTPLFVLNPRAEILDAGPWVFLNAFFPARQARAMARYAVRVEKRSRFAILAPDSDYGREVTEAFSAEVHSLERTVVRVAYFPADNPDFSPWIKALVHMDSADIPARLRSAGHAQVLDPTDPPPPASAGELEPWADFDALFLPAKAHEVRLIAPQAAFYGIASPQVTLLGTSLWNRPELLDEGTDYLDGAVFSDTDQEAGKWFRETFHQAWGVEPTPLATLAYDSVGVLAQLFREERMGGPPWFQALTRQQPFQGATGPVRFLQDGRSWRPYHMLRVGDGRVAYLSEEPEPPRSDLPPRVIPPPPGMEPSFVPLDGLDEETQSVLRSFMGSQPDAALDDGDTGGPAPGTGFGQQQPNHQPPAVFSP